MRDFFKLFNIKKEETFKATLPGNNDTGAFNPHSATWIFIKEWCEIELEKLRRLNDSIAMDVAKTACIRGEIRRLKKILDLPKNKY